MPVHGPDLRREYVSVVANRTTYWREREPDCARDDPCSPGIRLGSLSGRSNIFILAGVAPGSHLSRVPHMMNRLHSTKSLLGSKPIPGI
jgi:hypothetical protein